MKKKRLKNVAAFIIAALLMLSTGISTWAIDGYSVPQQSYASSIILPDGSTDGRLDAVIKGNTLVNLLGDSGDCESLSKLSPNASITAALDTTTAYFGTYSIKALATAVSSGHGADIKFNVASNKKYFISGYLTPANGGATLRAMAKDDLGQYTYTATSEKITSAKRVGCILNVNGSTPGNDALVRVSVYDVNGNGVFTGTNESVSFDGIMAVQMTSEDEGLTVDQLLQKYQFVNGIKSTSPVRVKSVGKNLFNPYTISAGKIYNGQSAVLNGNLVVVDVLDYEVSRIYINNDSHSAFLGFVTDFIGVQESTPYTFSAVAEQTTLWNPCTANYNYYDINKRYIGYMAGPNNLATFTFTPPAGTAYVKISILNKDITTSTISNIQIEKGSVATAYEPYKESSAYLSKELKALPNGVRDEMNLTTNSYIQKVSNWNVFDGNASGAAFSTDYVGYKRILCNIDAGNINNSEMVVLYNGSLARKAGETGWIDANIAQVWGGKLYLTISDSESGWAESYTPTSQDINNYLAAHPCKLIYQLAKPNTYGIAPQPVLAFKNGTVTLDKTIKAANTYSTKMSVVNTTFPIRYLESVNKIDGNLIKPIDLKSIAVAADGLSFTISGAVKGEMYEYIYKYKDELSASPIIKYSVPMDTASQSNGNTDILKTYSNLVNTLLSRVDSLEALINIHAKVNAVPIQVNCIASQTFNVVLTASAAQDIGRCTFTVIYDPAKVQVTDLCTATPAKELAAGYISGANITILQHDTSSGIIVFTIDGAGVPNGNTWSGLADMIEFRALSDCTTTITYTVE